MLNFAVDASADRCVVLALDDEGGRRAREARKKREQTNVEGIAVIPLHKQGTQAGHDASNEETGELVYDAAAGPNTPA